MSQDSPSPVKVNLKGKSLSLLVLRIGFVLLAAGFGIKLINADVLSQIPIWVSVIVFIGVMILATGVIAFDSMFREKQISVITSVYFGLLIGLLITWILNRAVIGVLTDEWVIYEDHATALIGIVICYVSISVLLQTRDDFRFIIPYVEFSREMKGNLPLLLDTSVIIDGRIADVVEAGVLDAQLIMPRFIINELQNIADSHDKLRRTRGRRGLDILNRMRTNTEIDIQIFDHEPPELTGQAVDLKLVLLAKHMNGNIVTNDYNLNKVSKLHGIKVVNLNDLANALKPAFLPGETLDVRVAKAGEGAGQGVGYLDDGTMIVIEGGREHIGQDVHIQVTSVLQTSAGRMVFGKVA